VFRVDGRQTTPYFPKLKPELVVCENHDMITAISDIESTRCAA
jgi:hypothetical protein